MKTRIQAPTIVVIIPIQIDTLIDFSLMSQLAGKVNTKLRIMNEEVKKLITDALWSYSCHKSSLLSSSEWLWGPL